MGTEGAKSSILRVARAPSAQGARTIRVRFAHETRVRCAWMRASTQMSRESCVNVTHKIRGGSAS
jgi:hypothetical protein